jgi:putative ABC transport system permease protein
MTPAPDDDTPAGERSIFRRSVDREVDDELAFHLSMRALDLAASIDAAEAERMAAAEFGDIARVKSECRRIANRRDRHMRRTRFVHELVQDLQFAVRLLRRRRSYAALAVLTIALGIGAATSIFSVVDGVLLRALPFADPGQLVAVWITQPSLAKDPVLSGYANRLVFGSTEYFALRDHTSSFRNVAAWTGGPSMLAGTAGVERVTTVEATASLLPLLGEHPALGRGLLPEENVLHGPKVALVGWETWQSRYGGDSSVVGHQVNLDDNSYTIVGVLPRGLRLDRTAEAPAFWLPAMQTEFDIPSRHNRSLHAVARLRPSVTAAAAQAEVASVVRAADADTTLSARVDDWQYDQTRDARAPLFIMLAASGLLLLIGCVNVAMLTLGESASREREFAARIALGASGGRVVRQLLAESMAIALVGAACGTALAWGLTRALVSLAPSRLPGIDTVGVDVRALAFAIGCAACAGILTGLAPALALARAGEISLLRVGAGQSSRNARGTQRGLVAAEIALSFVLLVGAALLSRSLGNLSAVNPGFRSANLAVVSLTAPAAFHRDDTRQRAYFTEGIRRLRALPGIEAVSAASYVPFTGGGSSSPVGVEGRVYDARHHAEFTQQASVSPGYLELLAIPLRAGRTFTDADRDGAELVAVINESAALRDFPAQSPVGRRVTYQGTLRRVVGVVGDAKSTKLDRDAAAAIYLPAAQYSSGTMSFVLRTNADPAALSPAIRSALQDIDATVTPMPAARLPALVARSYADERYRTTIVAAFAALAAVLAGVGLYGVTLRAVARRTREAGIRVALGATAGMVTRLMMVDTVAGVALGVVAGVVPAVFAASRLSPYLFGVTAHDPVVFGGVLGLLAIVAVTASVLPARRAGRTNPATVLGAE